MDGKDKPDYDYLTEKVSRGEDMKDGPVDLSKGGPSTPWNDAMFREKFANEKNYFPSDRSDVDANTAAFYCIKAYFGVLPYNHDSFILAWKSLNSGVNVQNTLVYPVGNETGKVPSVGSDLSTDKYTFPSGAASGRWDPAENVSFKKEDIQAFFTRVEKELKDTKKSQNMVNLVSYLIDTCFRVSQKEIGDVAVHISTRSKDTFNSVCGASETKQFPPPDLTFITEFQSNWTTQMPCFKNRLAALCWIMLECPETNVITKGWLTATSMLAFSGTGLGLIMWYRKMVAETERDMDEAIKYMMIDPLFRGVRRLYEWGDTMGDKEVTWMWCRLLQPTALAKYSVAYNIKFTLICALVVFGLDRDRVEDIKQFSGKTALIDAVMPIAKALYINLGGSLKSARAIGLGEKTREVMQELEREQKPRKKKAEEFYDAQQQDSEDEDEFVA